MKKRDGLNSVEADLINGLEGLVKDLKADAEIPKKYTCRRLVLNLEPQAYTPAMVKATRQLLKASQAVFAKFLGVSVKTVRAWEGGREPKDMACRFMDEIQRNPEYWRNRLQESAKVKTCEA